MVGSAVAYGLARRGADVALLDEGDIALRAARGNFGLIWTLSKDGDMPAYTAWGQVAVAAWPDFAEAMASAAGHDIGYRRAGGLAFCLSEHEQAERAAQLRKLHNQLGTSDAVLLDRKQLAELMPATPLGPSVIGAAFTAGGGHVNPLHLLKGLHAGLRRHGGRHQPGTPVVAIEPRANGFRLQRADGTTLHAERILIASGVATTKLAAMVGLDVPVKPVRGQIIVTERMRPLLPLPASALRQTEEGTFTIGVSHEDAGLDIGTTVNELARMAARALKVLPALAKVRIVRAWAALRPMTPDAVPVYAESPSCRGAFVAVCHAGVTLAALHADTLSAAVHDGALPACFAPFHPARFAAPQAVAPDAYPLRSAAPGPTR